MPSGLIPDGWYRVALASKNGESEQELERSRREQVRPQSAHTRDQLRAAIADSGLSSYRIAKGGRSATARGASLRQRGAEYPH